MLFRFCLRRQSALQRRFRLLPGLRNAIRRGRDLGRRLLSGELPLLLRRRQEMLRQPVFQLLGTGEGILFPQLQQLLVTLRMLRASPRLL